MQELVECRSIRKASSAHLDVIEQTKVSDLMQHSLLVVLARHLEIVGLEASHVVRHGLRESRYESIGLRLCVIAAK